MKAETGTKAESDSESDTHPNVGNDTNVSKSLTLRNQTIVVTGGAGLVGSHLADHLSEANDVIIADDLSKGTRDQVPDNTAFVEADMTNPSDVESVITSDVDIVFHLAAYTDTNFAEPRRLFEENSDMTYNILEQAAAVGVEGVAFTSSSTVYGEAPRPTPEDYAPLEPISVYGASKLADEGLLSTYAYTESLTVWCFRFANIVGPKQRGNVIPDFIEKLLTDPESLTILGDGRQEKSYLYVTECVDAICHIVEYTDEPMNIYNIGTETTTSVTTIADIVSDVMCLDPTYNYTGGDRGWDGDVPRMRLSVEKLQTIGWSANTESDAAVRRAAEELYDELKPSNTDSK
ncbi:NAD-dependent epimerase/dehydratase family protein [Haloquadratum walsbyi]|uniref:Nucleoside-diphosphate-sugar epimerase n=1 Tax=Haloquadratum walsbyi J07HQW2 TaxID=1238425 RepID=U1MW71_9EURY|nr:NAD-dependent epimerase/dehydratase family protein [Haloquadratum walsbyi]ERG94679.1 MAG: nucleoside-diphosphate-sugar epimerase [Haloquadratum walsbyi J07HQW2]